MFATSDSVDLITEGREKLAVEDRSGWSTAALGDRLMTVAAERERLDAELVRLTAAFDARGGWADDGYASATAWLAHNAPLTKPGAARLVPTARHVQAFTATAAALADGADTTEKVEVLAEAARHREEYYERDEALLLDAASRLDVRDLTTVTRTWRQLADDELADDDGTAAFERVTSTCRHPPRGVLAGFLDPQDGPLTRAGPRGAARPGRRSRTRLGHCHDDGARAWSRSRSTSSIAAAAPAPATHGDGAPHPAQCSRSLGPTNAQPTAGSSAPPARADARADAWADLSRAARRAAREWRCEARGLRSGPGLHDRAARLRCTDRLVEPRRRA
jgi:hypothetical protein